MKKLFLDDIRELKDDYPKYIDYSDEENWDVVRNYNEFIDYISNLEIPEIISFDHDLADSHYTPMEYWDDYNKSKEWQEQQVHTEKTGYDCAKWLSEYLHLNNIPSPKIVCHSMNPVGRDNILSVFNLKI